MKSIIPFILTAFISCNSINKKIEADQNTYNKQPDTLTTQANSRQKIQYKGKSLTYIQDLLDSSNSQKGKVYVEFIDKDSLFKCLYIFDGKEVKYFVGDSVITNFIHTEETDPNFGMRFDSRTKYHLEFFMVGHNGIGASDPINVEFISLKNNFGTHFILNLEENNNC